MCVCWSRASVCGSREPARATFRATGRSASCRSSAQEDAGERAPAQLLDQLEAGDRLAGLGERRPPARAARAKPSRSGPSRPARGCRGPGGAAAPTSGNRARYSAGSGASLVLLAEAELLVDQGDQGLVVEVGVAVAIPLGADPLARLPAQRQVGAEQRQPGAGTLVRVVGQEVVGSGRRASPRSVPRRVAPGGLEPPGQAGRPPARPASSQVRPDGGQAHPLSPPTPSCQPPCAAAEVLQHALDGPLADPEPLADVLLESPSAFSSRIAPALLGQQVAEPAEDLAGLRDLAGRVDRRRRPPWAGRRRPRAAPRGACPASGWRRGGTRRSPCSSQPGPGRRQGAANPRTRPARVRTRRKKLPQTLWRKSSESNRDRRSRGNCRRTTSRTSAS